MGVSDLEYEVNLILNKIRDTNLRNATAKLLIHFVGELKSLERSVEDLRRELHRRQDQR